MTDDWEMPRGWVLTWEGLRRLARNDSARGGGGEASFVGTVEGVPACWRTPSQMPQLRATWLPSRPVWLPPLHEKRESSGWAIPLITRLAPRQNERSRTKPNTGAVTAASDASKWRTPGCSPERTAFECARGNWRSAMRVECSYRRDPWPLSAMPEWPRSRFEMLVKRQPLERCGPCPSRTGPSAGRSQPTPDGPATHPYLKESP
jgi:hypothetical protein